MTTNLKLTESAPSTETDGDAAPVSAMRSSTGVDGEDSRGFDREVAVLEWAAMLRFVHLSAPVSRLGFQLGGEIRDREGWRLG
ncbi:unnamed protein product [Linum trigynum]|uniref:Uncharacterized protein n=1 Tax=Linum trigynum TaxID=586398 RepID=A0AAV2GKY8_9ROSI